MHESSRAMIDFSFGVRGFDVAAFLRRAFVDGRGVFGHGHQIVGVDASGAVVATMTAYRGGLATRLTIQLLFLAIRHYSLRAFVDVVRRALAIAPLFIPPSRDAVFLANACVATSLRGRGIFTAMLDAVARTEVASPSHAMELDVSFGNTSAERLYRRLGFKIVDERPYRGDLPLDGFRRMRLER
jgi:ribosomal protein S18 acetylase RimI-like enzyme